MLSGNSEVSCLNRDPSHDVNDNFMIECERQESGSVVTGNTVFYLKNMKLNYYLYTSKYNNFHEGNCGNRCPILGQLEVSGVASRNANCKWKVDGGVFIDEELKENQETNQRWVFDENEAKDIQLNTEL